VETTTAKTRKTAKNEFLTGIYVSLSQGTIAPGKITGEKNA
jgi:hypothetical protein